MTNTIHCKNGCCELKTWPYITHHRSPIFDRNEHKAGIIMMTPDDRMLIVRSRGNRWGFPKGGCRKDESALEGATREFKEETGLQVFKTGSPKKISSRITYFMARATEPYAVNINKIRSLPYNDSSGIGWIKLECLKTMDIPLNYPLRQYLKRIS